MIGTVQYKISLAKMTDAFPIPNALVMHFRSEDIEAQTDRKFINQLMTRTDVAYVNTSLL